MGVGKYVGAGVAVALVAAAELAGGGGGGDEVARPRAGMLSRETCRELGALTGILEDGTGPQIADAREDVAMTLRLEEGVGLDGSIITVLDAAEGAAQSPDANRSIALMTAASTMARQCVMRPGGPTAGSYVPR